VISSRVLELHYSLVHVCLTINALSSPINKLSKPWKQSLLFCPSTLPVVTLDVTFHETGLSTQCAHTAERNHSEDKQKLQEIGQFTTSSLNQVPVFA